MEKILGACLATLFAFCMLSVSGLALLAFVDKTVYTTNETAILKINRTQNVNITGVVTYASNGTQVDNFTIPNGSAGMIEYYYPKQTGLGNFKITLTEVSDSVDLYFEVVNVYLKPVVRFMGAATPIFVNTSRAVNTENGSLTNANFTKLFAFNLSSTIYYGEKENLTGDGRKFSFVVVDERAAGVYDSVYIDDDRIFQLFNDTEDSGTTKFIETAKSPGDMLEADATHRYIIVDINTTSGNGVYLIVPPSSPTYSSSDMLYMTVLVTDSNGNIYPNKTVNVSILDESKAFKNTTLVNIGSEGHIDLAENLSGYAPGKYFIVANETPVEIFKVESFKLHGKVTDISNNPTMEFAPGSKAKIWAVSRDANGDLQNLASDPIGTMMLPDGSTETVTFSAQPNSTGVYTATTSTLTETGEYKVEIQGTDGTSTEKFDVGFRVQSIEMIVEVLNPKYIDEGAGPNTMVTAFAPGSNVTAAIFMINTTKGSGLKSGGPPCGFDGQGCVQVSCDAAQFDVVIRDDLGNKYALNSSQGEFSAMTIETAAASVGLPPPSEPGMKDQCMIMIWGENNTWSNKTRNYKLEIKFSNDSIGNLVSGTTFSIKRLLAQGSTVDFKGDSFSFFAPNSTVRVKLEIRNMVTDELLQASDIMDARFTEMWKEWPNRKNALTDMAGFDKTTLNESIEGDTIVFTSPPEEGFYMAEFRFRANVSGQVLEGTGNIFFELKKYLIWADLDSMSEGNWYAKVGENISLTVSIMDIDMGFQYGKGSTATCTGCTGLVATIDKMFNEQFFKQMQEGTDYTITEGIVVNSTSGASITIHPIGSNMPSGWYGVDILLNDTATGNTYYGWGGFEIRNFWVDIFEVQNNSGNYTRAGGGGPESGTTVPVGGSVLLGIAAFSPPTKFSPPTPLTVINTTPIVMEDERMWPPLPVSSSKYSVTYAGTKNVTEEWGIVPTYLVNLTIANDIEESSYRLSFDVQASGVGSDIGTAHITVSPYTVSKYSVPLAKMFEWPPVYASTENLVLVINATDFNYNPHNLTNITIGELFSEKSGRPIKMRYGQNYTNNCTGQASLCNITINLSGLSAGEYFMELEINDTQGKLQSERYGFEIKNILFSVPLIYEGYTNYYSTPEKNLDAPASEDTCDNQLWLMEDNHPEWGNTTNNIGGWFNGSDINLTIPYNKSINPSYGWGIFCINTQEGRWHFTSGQGEGACPGEYVYMVSNGTNTWINITNNMPNTTDLTNGSFFELSNYQNMTWKIEEYRQDDNRYVRIKYNGSYICARNDHSIGDGKFLKVIPPAGHVNYSSFYHGPNYIVGDIHSGQPCTDCIETMMNIADRPAYVYHNTTHIWIFPSLNGTINFTNSSTKGPYAVGDTAEDGYGGRWRVMSISKSSITLKGENTLANGIMVNTSLSTSGKIYYGQLREEDMGFENKFSSEKQGIDLDGDGLKNGTLYFLIMDNGNGYNTLAYSNYSQKWNFTDTSRIVNTSETNRSMREVGLGNQKLTLLSIDPRASKVMFYDSNVTGEWPELGDAKYGDNVTIPVIIKSPDGNPIAANVSVPHIKVKNETKVDIVPTGLLNATEINGIGELRINLSALGYGSGRYEFEIVANSSTYGVEKMNEWMWPRSTIRNFLVDMYAGYGGIITEFASMTANVYGGPGGFKRMLELRTINGTGYDGQNFSLTGVAARAENEMNTSQCPNWTEPSGVLNGTNYTYRIDDFDGQYFLYFNQNETYNNNTVWIKQGDCNFSNANNYSVGDKINITLHSDLFMFYILNISSTGKAYIGVDGLNGSHEPVRVDNWGPNKSPMWVMMSINRSGSIYNPIFANVSSLLYPQSAVWGGGSDVVKAVWIDTDGDGNFTNAKRYLIGENFTANEYIARLGPKPWEGLIIADSSNLSGIGVTQNPGMDIRVQDSTPSYFGRINESDSSLMLDLNMDNDLNDIFYMVAFDEFEDSNQQVTRLYVDDDLNITEPWWCNSSEHRPDQFYNYQYYDFYGNESGGMAEQEGNPPQGMWGGHMWFAPQNSSIEKYYQKPEWEIKSYNGTKMILGKHAEHLNKHMTISLTIKVFDFAQNPISGANVSLQKFMRFGAGQPFKELNESAGDYTLINTQNVSDSNGFAMLKLQPPAGGWSDQAEYIAEIKIEYGGMEENLREWFMMGEKEMMP